VGHYLINKPLCVDIPADALKSLLITQLKRQKKVVHMHHSAPESVCQKSGKSALAAAATPVDGYRSMPAAVKQRLDCGNKLIHNNLGKTVNSY
jgi:ribosomal protein L32